MSRRPAATPPGPENSLPPLLSSSLSFFRSAPLAIEAFSLAHDRAREAAGVAASPPPFRSPFLSPLPPSLPFLSSYFQPQTTLFCESPRSLTITCQTPSSTFQTPSIPKSRRPAATPPGPETSLPSLLSSSLSSFRSAPLATDAFSLAHDRVGEAAGIAANPLPFRSPSLSPLPPSLSFLSSYFQSQTALFRESPRSLTITCQTPSSTSQTPFSPKSCRPAATPPGPKISLPSLSSSSLSSFRSAPLATDAFSLAHDRAGEAAGVTACPLPFRSPSLSPLPPSLSFLSSYFQSQTAFFCESPRSLTIACQTPSSASQTPSSPKSRRPAATPPGSETSLPSLPSSSLSSFRLAPLATDAFSLAHGRAGEAACVAASPPPFHSPFLSPLPPSLSFSLSDLAVKQGAVLPFF